MPLEVTFCVAWYSDRVHIATFQLLQCISTDVITHVRLGSCPPKLLLTPGTQRVEVRTKRSN